MRQPLGPPREVGEGYKYVSLGLTFAGGVILFMAIGFGLDHLLGWTPILTVLGTLGGSVMSFLNVYWKLQADERKHQQEIDAEKEKKP